MASDVRVIVPRRSGNDERDRLWKFARTWWTTDHPYWEIIEAEHNDGPFNRSKAINQGAAGDWDVAIVIDADILANPDAVRAAVEIAAATGRMVLPHNERVMLNKATTAKILDGYRGNWRLRNMVETVYNDSVSCVVAIPRCLWDKVGGFDELFVGWGYEDSAFAIAVETLTGKPYVRLVSELFHLHHTLAPEASRRTDPLRLANGARLERYKQAAGDPAAVRALLDEPSAPPLELLPSRIPRILHRTVTADTEDQVEDWWAYAQALHPGWEARTYREPLNPADWPLTGDLWPRCKTGAQKAGLIRLEALIRDGGWYLDSDVEPVRSLEPFAQCSAVAGWEDRNCVPDAVLAAEPNHPAMLLCLEKARSVIEGGGDAWQSGPGVTTEALPGRHDVLLLPPGSFYEIHYLEKAKLNDPHPPYAFLRHHWAGSWLTPAQRRSQRSRQRT